MLNIVTIHAIRKTSETSSLPKTLKTLFLSLAVSDLGVGLVVQPFNIALLVKWLEKNSESTSSYTMQIVFSVVMSLFSCASFFGVFAISVDRFLAIRLHLRYQELVTHKRVVAAVISTWVFSAFFSSIKLWMPANVNQPITIFVAIFFGLFYICTTIIYYDIYLTVGRHRNRIQSLQVQHVVQNSEEMAATNVANVNKSAVSAFYVYLAFVLCYLPGYCMMISRMIVSEPNIAMESFDPYSWTLVFINSSLNPVIYCLKMRRIRHAIMDILRNLFPSHN